MLLLIPLSNTYNNLTLPPLFSIRPPSLPAGQGPPSYNPPPRRNFLDLTPPGTSSAGSGQGSGTRIGTSGGQFPFSRLDTPNIGLSATLTAAEMGAVPAHVSLLLSKSLSSLPTDLPSSSTHPHYPNGGQPSGSMGAYVSGGASVSSHPSIQSTSSSALQQQHQGGGLIQQPPLSQYNNHGQGKRKGNGNGLRTGPSGLPSSHSLNVSLAMSHSSLSQVYLYDNSTYIGLMMHILTYILTHNVENVLDGRG